VHTSEIVQAWGKILKGEPPSLSIESRVNAPECPAVTRTTTRIWARADLARPERSKGQSLVDGVLEVVDRLKPLHLSIVGGDRWSGSRTGAADSLLLARGIHVQVVTSAFRTMGRLASLPRCT